MTEISMPQYRSHKTVGALKIERCENTQDDTKVLLTFADDKYPTQLVDVDVVSRHWPVSGDYLVRYADGYLSISPAAPFEEGYTLL